jgi:hypothetical protein
MDSAVWVMQSVVDQRRSDREAEAAAHRQAKVARRSGASGRRLWPSRRPRRFHPVPAAPAVAMATAPEPVGDDLELVAAGDSR